MIMYRQSQAGDGSPLDSYPAVRYHCLRGTDVDGVPKNNGLWILGSVSGALSRKERQNDLQAETKRSVGKTTLPPDGSYILCNSKV